MRAQTMTAQLPLRRRPDRRSRRSESPRADAAFGQLASARDRRLRQLHRRSSATEGRAGRRGRRASSDPEQALRAAVAQVPSAAERRRTAPPRARGDRALVHVAAPAGSGGPRRTTVAEIGADRLVRCPTARPSSIKLDPLHARRESRSRRAPPGARRSPPTETTGRPASRPRSSPPAAWGRTSPTTCGSSSPAATPRGIPWDRPRPSTELRGKAALGGAYELMMQLIYLGFTAPRADPEVVRPSCADHWREQLRARDADREPERSPRFGAKQSFTDHPRRRPADAAGGRAAPSSRPRSTFTAGGSRSACGTSPSCFVGETSTEDRLKPLGRTVTSPASPTPSRRKVAPARKASGATSGRASRPASSAYRRQARRRRHEHRGPHLSPRGAVVAAIRPRPPWDALRGCLGSAGPPRRSRPQPLAARSLAGHGRVPAGDRSPMSTLEHRCPSSRAGRSSMKRERTVLPPRPGRRRDSAGPVPPTSPPSPCCPQAASRARAGQTTAFWRARPTPRQYASGAGSRGAFRRCAPAPIRSTLR